MKAVTPANPFFFTIDSFGCGVSGFFIRFLDTRLPQ